MFPPPEKTSRREIGQRHPRPSSPRVSRSLPLNPSPSRKSVAAITSVPCFIPREELLPVKTRHTCFCFVLRHIILTVIAGIVGEHYQHLCTEFLSQVYVPAEALLCQQEGCCIHCDDLQEYYASIVNSLISASNIGVRQITLGVEKHWWTPELSDLKQQCIELTDIWRQHGCPRSGPIIENR